MTQTDNGVGPSAMTLFEMLTGHMAAQTVHVAAELRLATTWRAAPARPPNWPS